MIVGAARGDGIAAADQRRRERLGVLDDLARIDLEVGLQRFAEGHRLAGDDMHQRTALQAGEDRRIDLLGDVRVVRQDEAAARAAQRLVRRRGDDMRVRERRRMHAARHETGEMRHIDEEIGADGIGDLAELLEIPEARIARAAGDDELRLMLLREAGDLLHVDAVVVLADAIGRPA